MNGMQVGMMTRILNLEANLNSIDCLRSVPFFTELKIWQGVKP